MGGEVEPAKSRKRASWSSALGRGCKSGCWICDLLREENKLDHGKAHRGRRHEVCSRHVLARERLYEALKRIRESERCSVCQKPAVPGLRHCEPHRWLPEPCPGGSGKRCGERIRRREGQGNQPKLCPACRKQSRIEAELRGEDG